MGFLIMGPEWLLLERQSQRTATFQHLCMLRTQLEQSPVAPGKLQPSTAADAVIGVHAEKGLRAGLGEPWTCPAHPVTALHKAGTL